MSGLNTYDNGVEKGRILCVLIVNIFSCTAALPARRTPFLATARHRDVFYDGTISGLGRHAMSIPANAIRAVSHSRSRVHEDHEQRRTSGFECGGTHAGRLSSIASPMQGLAFQMSWDLGGGFAL